MKLTIKTFALLILSLLTCNGFGQVQTSGKLITRLVSDIQYRAQLDSSVNVNALSSESRNQLIERMFVIDQQYRSEIGSDMHRQDAKTKQARRMMRVNDRSNQSILLRIVRRYGWPCNEPKRQLGFKAYIIAWHARDDYDRMIAFYPHLLKAARAHCLAPAHEQEYRTWIAQLKKAYHR